MGHDQDNPGAPVALDGTHSSGGVCIDLVHDNHRHLSLVELGLVDYEDL
jgi:hypothetical protein